MRRERVTVGLAFAYRRYFMKYDLDEKAAAVRGAGLHTHQVQSRHISGERRRATLQPPNKTTG